MALGDERRGTPTLIAVSSFGESLPRVTPLTAPGEAPLTPRPRPLASPCYLPRVVEVPETARSGKALDDSLLLAAASLASWSSRQQVSTMFSKLKG